jgi:CRP/FNR family transcriptional regulator, cyclic AMP receptor protein
MTADGIWANIFRFGSSTQPLGEILQNIPLFSDLTPKELRILEHVVHLRSYQPEETVFAEDEPGAGVYVVRSGKVDILLKHENQSSTLLAELEAGDFFGEMALLGDSTRSATAVAREPSELIGFFHPDLLEIINLHPVMGAKITFGLARTLAERLRFTNAQLREISEFRGSREEPVR